MTNKNKFEEAQHTSTSTSTSTRTTTDTPLNRQLAYQHTPRSEATSTHPRFNQDRSDDDDSCDDDDPGKRSLPGMRISERYVPRDLRLRDRPSSSRHMTSDESTRDGNTRDEHLYPKHKPPRWEPVLPNQAPKAQRPPDRTRPATTRAPLKVDYLNPPPTSEWWANNPHTGKSGAPFDCTRYPGHEKCPTRAYTTFGFLANHLASIDGEDDANFQRAANDFHLTKCIAGDNCKYADRTKFGNWTTMGNCGGQTGHPNCPGAKEETESTCPWAVNRREMQARAKEWLPRCVNSTIEVSRHVKTTKARWAIMTLLREVTRALSMPYPETDVSNAICRFLACGPNISTVGKNPYQACDRMRDPSLPWPPMFKDSAQLTPLQRASQGWETMEKTNDMEKALRVILGDGVYKVETQADLDAVSNLFVKANTPSEPPRERNPRGPVPPAMSEAQVMALLRTKAGQGTAPGVSGFTADHFLDALEAKDSPWPQAFTQLVNYMMQGGLLGTPARTRLTAVKLTLLAKGPNKEDGARPIAVMEFLANFVSAMVNKTMLGPAVMENLPPGDLGPRGTAEAAGPIIRAKLTQLMNQWPGVPVVVLQADMKNAYGHLDRRATIEAVKAIAPEAGPWFETALAGPTTAFFKGLEDWDEFIMQNMGISQGDSTSVNAFHAAVAIAAGTVRVNHTEVTAITYVDDIWLVGLAKRVLAALETLHEKWNELGLVSAPSKLCGYIAGGTEQQREELIKELSEAGVNVKEGIMVAGTPVGTINYQRARTQEKFNEINKSIKAILKMKEAATDPDKPVSQSTLRILTMAVPSSATFILRTVDPWISRPFTVATDAAIADAALVLMGVTRPRKEAPWRMMKWRLALPTHMGGFGITCLHEIADAAHVGAAVLYMPLISKAVDPTLDLQALEEMAYPGLAAARERIAVFDNNTRAEAGDGITGAALEKHNSAFEEAIRDAQMAGGIRRDGVQRSLTQALHGRKWMQVRLGLRRWSMHYPMAEADFMSQCSPSAGGPLTMPLGCKWTLVLDDTFATYALLRLGGNLPGYEDQDTLMCPMGCKRTTAAASHSLSCEGMRGYRVTRHGNVKSAMCCVLRSTNAAVMKVGKAEPNLSPTFTPRNLGPGGNNLHCRGDIEVRVGSEATLLIFDLVIGGPRAAECTAGNANDPRKATGNISRRLELEKWTTLEHTHIVHDKNRNKFAPFAIENSGHIGTKSHEIFSKLIALTNASTKESRITGGNRVSGQYKAQTMRQAYARITNSVHMSNKSSVEHMTRMASGRQPADQDSASKSPGWKHNKG